LGYSFSSFAFNNIDDLLDKSEITWAAEVYTDYAPNVTYFWMNGKKIKAKYGISNNAFVTLKIQQELNNAPLRMHPITLANQVLKMEPDSKATFFKNSTLKEPLSYAEYQKITQETTFDTTFISQADGTSIVGHIITRKVHFDGVSLFRVKQILHYNEKTNELVLTPVSIAPIFCVHDKEGNLVGTSPLFWMPIKDLNQEIDLNSPAVNWAKRMTRSIDTDEVTVIKGKRTLAEILNTMSIRYTQEPELSKLYHTYGKMLPMNSEDIKGMKNSIDTVITFHPETFEEIVSIIETTITPKTMHEIRIIQDWVWNAETQSINIKLVAFAPILKRYDNKNNFICSIPFFYKKADD
jgi:hypothetical protein